MTRHRWLRGITVVVAMLMAQSPEARGRGNASQAPSAPAGAHPPTVDRDSPRIVARPIGRALESLLRSSDRELVVVDSMRTTGNAEVDPSGSRLPPLVKHHDLIAVVEVVSVVSALTDDKTWIRSTVSARVIDVWKKGPSVPHQYGEESVVTFEWDGGTATIDGRRVTARVDWSGPLEPGKRYLVFGWFPYGELRIPLTNVYEQHLQSFRSVGRKAYRPIDDIERESADSLKARVAGS